MRKLQRAPEEALNTQDADKSGGKAFFAAHKQRLRKANTADAGKPGIHESANKHVTGTATYVDDIPELPNTLHLAAGGSAYANAAIVDMNLDPVCTSEGVIGVFTHRDVPGHIDIAPVFTGDPLLIQDRSQFLGQPLFFVAATSYHQALLAAQKAQVEYDIDEPVVRLKDALAKGDTVLPEHVMSSGDSLKAISNAAHQLAGSGYMRGQEHLYLEGQVAYAQPTEDGGMHVFTSSQHPSEVQKLVAEVLAIGAHLVTAEVRRMGGGFGGKESQAAAVACAAALAAWHLQRPVKYRMPRRQDMETTGKRHDFQFDYRIGFSANGVITGTEIELAGLCGCSADLSQGIVDRAMFHADNAYSLGAANVVGKAPRTHTVSNTAFRGFGGPKGMVAIETMMDDIARTLGEDPLAIRKRNLYRADANTTHYGQPVEFEPIHEIMGRLEQTSDYWHRRSEITEFNQANRWVKKGLALTPVKFGISFTSSHLNQAGALVHIYTDGTILVNHGGTEMGQGLYTKIAQLVANCFGVSSDYVHVTSTRTDKIANTSPTAASSGTDLNGYAAHNACEQIVAALTEFAAEQFAVATDQVQFNDNQVRVGEKSFGFAEFCKLA